METSCGEAGSRDLVACVFEGDGRMLCYVIESVVHSVTIGQMYIFNYGPQWWG